MSKFSDIVGNFHLSRLGWWLAFALTAAGVAMAWWLWPSPPSLAIELVNISKVYDLNADVKDLKITFNHIDLRESKKALSVFTVRFRNTGKEAITPTMYDPKQLLGLSWDGGEMMSPEIVEASQSYLMENLLPKVPSRPEPSLGEGWGSLERKVVLEPVMIDGGAFFAVQTLVLHDDGTIPNVKAIGKIANIDFDKLKIENSVEKTPNFISIFSYALAMQLFTITVIWAGKILESRKKLFSKASQLSAD